MTELGDGFSRKKQTLFIAQKMYVLLLLFIRQT